VRDGRHAGFVYGTGMFVRGMRMICETRFAQFRHLTRLVKFRGADGRGATGVRLGRGLSEGLQENTLPKGPPIIHAGTNNLSAIAMLQGPGPKAPSCGAMLRGPKFQTTLEETSHIQLGWVQALLLGIFVVKSVQRSPRCASTQSREVCKRLPARRSKRAIKHRSQLSG